MRYLILISFSFSLFFAQNKKIEPIKVSNHIYMFKGSGGNVGVSVGEDGVLVVDSKFSDLHESIVAEILKLSDKPIRFLINTHFHGDHTGGNKKMGNAGLTIIAHENVRKRLQSPQYVEFFKSKTEVYESIALPSISFANSLNVHINGDDIETIYVANAHTDGDAIVFFKQSNVIHMGDSYFSGMYPFIDTGHGGSISGMIKAHEKASDIANKDTKFIPGHGAVTSLEELKNYTNMLRDIRDKVEAAKATGKSLKDIQAMNITAKHEAKYGKGFINAEAIVMFAYKSF